jgi:sulfite exporter TauE/SafE
MVPALLAALAAGLLGSVHCVAMCGPFAAACTRARGGLPAWHAGRVASYAALGALAGQFGQLLPGPPWVPAAVATLLLVWFALAIAGLVPEPRLIPPGLTAAGSRAAQSSAISAQLVFGVLNGFLPCGLVYSALGMAVAQATPLGGAAVMLAFGLGTLPALSLAALGVRRILLASPGRRRLFAALLLVTGLWMIWMRTGAPARHGTGHVHDHPAPSTPGRAED